MQKTKYVYSLPPSLYAWHMQWAIDPSPPSPTPHIYTNTHTHTLPLYASNSNEIVNILVFNPPWTCTLQIPQLVRKTLHSKEYRNIHLIHFNTVLFLWTWMTSHSSSHGHWMASEIVLQTWIGSIGLETHISGSSWGSELFSNCQIY